MKKIEAIIRPCKIEAVRSALADIGITGMTVIQAVGLGSQKGYIEMIRGEEVKVDFLAKAKIELVVDDDNVDDCLRVITEASRTGDIGDGKIYISSIEKIVRIRTGEIDTKAT